MAFDERLELLYKISSYATEPNLAIEYCYRLINLSEQVGQNDYLIKAYGTLGFSFKLKGDFDKAIESFYKSAKLAGSVGDQLAKGDAFANIAAVFNSNGNYDEAKKISLEAIDIYRDGGDTARLAIQYLNLGNTLYYLNELDSALFMLKSSKDLNKNIYADPYIDGTKALVLAEMGQFDEGRALLIPVIELWNTFEDHYARSDTYILFGQSLLKQGFTQESIQMVTSGHKIAKKYGLKKQIQDGSRVLFEAYLNLNKYEEAIRYQSEYHLYRDSIINAESIKKIANQQADYEVGLKQAEVDVLEAQRETQRALLIGLVIFISILLVLAVIIYRFYQSKNLLSIELGLQKIELEKLNSTKDKFFSIISHDLRGPVSAFLGISRMIKVLVQTKQTDELLTMTEEIDQSVDRLSSLLDNLLNWAMQQQGNFPNDPEKVNPKELVEELEGVFTTMASAKSIEINNNLEDDLFLLVDRNSTATIFRNLINNALKFTPEGGKIDISSTVSDNMCEISIKDTGVGIPQDKRNQLFTLQEGKSSYGTKGEKGLGLGLQLVNDFIKMNGGAIDVSS